MLVLLVRPEGAAAAASARTSMLHAPFDDDTCVRSPPAPSLPVLRQPCARRVGLDIVVSHEQNAMPGWSPGSIWNPRELDEDSDCRLHPQ